MFFFIFFILFLQKISVEPVLSRDNCATTSHRKAFKKSIFWYPSDWSQFREFGLTFTYF